MNEKSNSSSAVLNWMISGWRWLPCTLPKQLVSEGAISHARVRVGVQVFKILFNKVIASFQSLPADFYGRLSVVFDGSTGTMPDHWSLLLFRMVAVQSFTAGHKLTASKSLLVTVSHTFYTLLTNAQFS